MSRLSRLLNRDQLILFMVAVNEIMLGVDTYLSHVLNNTILFREWIAIIFGWGSGIILLGVGVIAARKRSLANKLATPIFILSIVVGLLGAYFHIIRGILPSAPLGERVTFDLLIWAPPILAPLAYAGVGLLGLSAAWPEEPRESGILHLPLSLKVQLPYPKSNAYFLMVSLGILVALVSSVLDHARHGWAHSSFWWPVIAGIFGTVVAAMMGGSKRPSSIDYYTYYAAMLLLIFVGVLGTYFHIRADLTTDNLIIVERFLRGAPFMSPLLFTNMGILGLIISIPSHQ